MAHMKDDPSAHRDTVFHVDHDRLAGRQHRTFDVFSKLFARASNDVDQTNRGQRPRFESWAAIAPGALSPSPIAWTAAATSARARVRSSSSASGSSTVPRKRRI